MRALITGKIQNFFMHGFDNKVVSRGSQNNILSGRNAIKQYFLLRIIRPNVGDSTHHKACLPFAYRPHLVKA